ncbi:S24 family peptidase [Rubrivirga marina]|uniref:LexA family protein n=1 Tax=Rubrivirga marina TaxID=1196024 RepID=UPI002481EECD|nr:S24 family peptidase [Rubrivirga marina]
MNLHELVEADSPSCFFLRVRGESMTGDGILDGDRIAVDRAEEPKNGSIVAAAVDGELTPKRFTRMEVRGRERVRSPRRTRSTIRANSPRARSSSCGAS